MISKRVLIRNKIGLHARPAALFVKKAGEFASEIIIKKGKHEANAKSIISIMALGATSGEEIVIAARGIDEEEAVNAMVELIENMGKEE